MSPKFPQVVVELSGANGNAFAILGATKKAMRRAGCPSEAIDAYTTEAMSGDYDHLIQTTMQYVTVE